MRNNDDLNYRARLMFGTDEHPDGMRAIGLLSDHEYEKRIEATILAVKDDPAAFAGALRDLAQIARFKELNSQKDTLTGLFNRSFYDEMLADQIKLIEQQNNPERRDNPTTTKGLAVLMVDMDRFKAINDNYGHLAGDEALKLAAKTMLENVRADDIVARTGGDEFSILLKNVTQQEAETILSNLQQGLDEMTMVHNDVQEIDVNASVGLAVLSQGMDIKQIAVNVDQDMMARKEARKLANPALRYDRG